MHNQKEKILKAIMEKKRPTKYTWRASLVTQLVKNPLAMQETLVWSLDWEDPYPLQYSGLENSMDCIVQGVVKNQTQLTEWISHTQIYIWKGRTRALFKNNAINKKYNFFKVLQIVILKFYTQPKKKKKR